MSTIHDFTLNSKLKNYTIAYDKDRQNELKKREDKNEKAEGLFRNPDNAHFISKKITMSTQAHNKNMTDLMLEHRNSKKRLETEKDKETRDFRQRQYEELLEQQKMAKR